MSTTAMRSTRNSGVAAVLSMFVPGVGQLYAGRWGWGLFWLIFTPGFWIGTGGTLGWICHILAAIQAANQVNKR
ncbi:MAG: TM2 domain-containing membrane protein YozV [Myxococcota bacterium]|jgi:TM2 domain-containing membrane protein YozV